MLRSTRKTTPVPPSKARALERARESTPAVSPMKNERSAICTSGITTVEWERWIWVGQESGRFQRAAIAGWRSDDSVYHPDRQFLWDRLRRFTARWVAHTDPPVVRMKVWRKNTPRATQRESVAKANCLDSSRCVTEVHAPSPLEILQIMTGALFSTTRGSM